MPLVTRMVPTKGRRGPPFGQLRRIPLAPRAKPGTIVRMPNIGPWEIILLLLLALLLFGAKRLPEIGRSLGSGMREFKDSVSGNKHDNVPELPPAGPGETTQPHASREETTV
jgi:sec-independent protein translocase protein TatA